MTAITAIIKNCNNIDNATIEIRQNELNIKYGINGTGKSTIVRAVELATDERKNLNELQPFKHRTHTDQAHIPTVEGITSILGPLSLGICQRYF